MRKFSFLVLTLGVVISLTLLVTPFLTAESNYSTTILPFTHFFTTAICNPTNFCEDYEVYCNNSEVLSIKSTGYTTQFPSGWQDFREKKTASTC